MPPSAEVLRVELQRAESAPAEPLAPAIRRLVADVPLRQQVLQIGCGTGVLSRELAAKRGAKVTAIDLAARMIDVARVRSSASLGIDYRVADIMRLSPRGFDVALAVDTLHHLPLAEIADRMAAAVVSGGEVLISDRFDARGVIEAPYNALSWLAAEPPEDPGFLPLRRIRAMLREVLPGVTVRRHLGWRYTARWQKP